MANSAIVLVVDDEPDLTASIERLLRRQGHRVVTANSWTAGRASMAATPPGLLVSDIRLTDGDGLDLVRVANALTPPVPAIVISGYLSAANHAAARAAGAVAILSKPFTVDEFSRAVDRALPK